MTLFLVVDIIDNINKFIESDITQKQILQYCILSIPSFISIALPMTTLLACIFTIGQLQKNHELTAIKASGISLRRISVNLIIIGLIISGLSFVFDNTIVSESIKKRRSMEAQYLDGSIANQKIRNFHIIYQEPKINNKKFSKLTPEEIFDLKNPDQSDRCPEGARAVFEDNLSSFECVPIIDNNNTVLLYLNDYDFITNKASNVVIQKINHVNNHLDFDLKNDTLIYKESTYSWIANKIKSRNKKNQMISENLDNDTLTFYIPDHYGDYIFANETTNAIKERFSKFKEKDLQGLLPKSEELNYWELKNLSSRRPDEIKLKVDYNFKVAFSFTSLIMILFGIGLSIKRPRTNYATGIGLGVIVIFLYYLGIKFGQSLGYSKILPPFISVWFVNFIFLSIGSWLFLKIRT